VEEMGGKFFLLGPLVIEIGGKFFLLGPLVIEIGGKIFLHLVFSHFLLAS
jgi:hypothetical protein